MIITISGNIGSGKSTVGKLLAEQLKFSYLSTGSIQRKIATEMGLSTLELNLLTESRKDIDDQIDGYTRALNDQTENYVVDSRLAWHFIPTSYKVYLLCQEEIAARRISADHHRISDDQSLPVDQLLEKILARRQSEKVRFLSIYGVDFADISNYDLVIDSALFMPSQIVEMILKGVELYKQ